VLLFSYSPSLLCAFAIKIRSATRRWGVISDKRAAFAWIMAFFVLPLLKAISAKDIHFSTSLAILNIYVYNSRMLYSTLQTVLILLTIGLAVSIILWFKKIEKRTQLALISSLLFMFSASMIVNTLTWVIDYRSFILVPIFMLLSLVAFGFSFLISFKIKDQERARHIFFLTSLVILVVCSVLMLANAIDGASNSRDTYLNAHLCRQIAYGFPVVYFHRERVRRFLLPFFVCASIVGGIFTIILPGALESRAALWDTVDTTILHMVMIFVALCIIITKEYIANFKDLIMSPIIYGVALIVAFVANIIRRAQIGEMGNSMFLANSPVEGMSIAVFIIGSYFIGILVAVGLAIYNQIRDNQNQPLTDGKEVG